MDDLVKKLAQLQNWKDIMRSSCKQNNICTSQAGELTPSKLQLLRQRFNKAYDLNQENFHQSWIEHEMRAFNWILIAISALNNVKIQEFTSSEWNSLYLIFQKKSPAFLRYETKRFLMEKCTKNKNWAPDENELLIEIISKYDKQKITWNQVARQLFQQSQEKYFRSAKHCRERWLNYLDPSKKRGDWTKQQDLQLLEKVEQDGKKWAKIGAMLNRTEHCVKNRYNSLISKQKKAIPSLRKQQKILEAVKRQLRHTTSEDKEIIQFHEEKEKQEEKQKEETEKEKEKEKQQTEKAQGQPKFKVKLKWSNESMFSMFSDNQSYNRSPFMSFPEAEPRNTLDYLQNYTLEGGDFIKHLVKDDQDGSNRNQAINLYPSFWNSSPKSLTPIGITPSPLSLNNYSLNYYIHNFNTSIQNQKEKEEENKNQ